MPPFTELIPKSKAILLQLDRSVLRSHLCDVDRKERDVLRSCGAPAGAFGHAPLAAVGDDGVEAE